MVILYISVSVTVLVVLGGNSMSALIMSGLHISFRIAVGLMVVDTVHLMWISDICHGLAFVCIHVNVVILILLDTLYPFVKRNIIKRLIKIIPPLFCKASHNHIIFGS